MRFRLGRAARREQGRAVAAVGARVPAPSDPGQALRGQPADTLRNP